MWQLSPPPYHQVQTSVMVLDLTLVVGICGLHWTKQLLMYSTTAAKIDTLDLNLRTTASSC